MSILKIMLRKLLIFTIIPLLLIVPVIAFGEDVTFKIKPTKQNFYYNENIVFNYSTNQVIPNTDYSISIKHNDKNVPFVTSYIKRIFTTEGQLIITQPQCNHLFPDDDIYVPTDKGHHNGLQRLECPPEGDYIVKVFYGNPSEPFATAETKFYFTPKLSPESPLENLFPTPIQVGGNWNIDKFDYSFFGIHLHPKVNFWDSKIYKGEKESDSISVSLLSWPNGNPNLEQKESCYGKEPEFYYGCPEILTQVSDFKCSRSQGNVVDYYSCDGEYYSFRMKFGDDIHPKNKELFTGTILDNIRNYSQNEIERKEKIASFVDQSKDPQHYIDRYNNEPKYKEWFDTNYPQYSSIYEAVGLKEIKSVEIVPEPTSISTKKVPDWVKNIFGWYANDQVSEDELLNAIRYLINQGILVVN